MSYLPFCFVFLFRMATGFCTGKECIFCSLGYYNLNYITENFSTLNCTQKNLGSVFRRVLVVENEPSKADFNKTLFMAIYSSVNEAFRNETYECSKFEACDLNLFFLKNTIFLRSDEIYSNDFFRQIKGKISIQPLFCSTLTTVGCIEVYSEVVIRFNDLNFLVYISSEMNLSNLTLDASSANYSDELQACEESSEALFEVEPNDEQILDGLIPKLTMFNVTLKNFSGRRACHLLRNLYYGISSLSFVSIISCTFGNSLFFFQNTTLSNNEDEENQSILSFSNINISDFRQDNNENYNYLCSLFYLMEWSSFVSIQKLEIFNISSTGLQFFVFVFIGIRTQTQILHISIKNSYNTGIIEMMSSNANISEVTMKDSKFLQSSIIIEIDSSFMVNDFKINDCIFLDLDGFFSKSYGNFILQNFLFENITNLIFSFSHSTLNLTNGSLANSYSKRLFIFDHSSLFIFGLVIRDAYIDVSFFLFYYSLNIKIYAVALINVLGISCIIENQNLEYEEFNDFLMKNTTSPYFFSPSPQINTFVLRKAIFLNINFYRIFYIPAKITLYFEDFYIKNLFCLYWQNSRSYIFQFMKTTLFMNRIVFQDVFGDINPFCMFHLSGGYISLYNSSFINIGWTNNRTSDFYSVDDNAVLYFFNEIDVKVDRIIQISLNVSVHGGFIVFTGGTGNFWLSNSFFKHYLTPNNYAMGVVVMSAKITTLVNNHFENMICPISKMRFSYFQHRNGPLAVLGEPILAKKKNSRQFLGQSNIFKNCQCSTGGALTVVNYNTTLILNCSFYNSTGLKSGGAFAVYSASFALLQEITTDISFSQFGSIAFLKNIDNCLINSSIFINSIGELSGSFQVENTKVLEIVSVFGRNLTTFGKGVFLLLNGFTAVIRNLSLKEISSDEGAFSVINSGNLKIFDSNFNSCISRVSGSVLSVYLGKDIYLNNVTFQNLLSFDNGAALIIKIIENFDARNLLISNATTSRAGILYFQCSNESANHFLSNVTCFQNKGIKGSCIYYESSSYLNIYNLNVGYCYGLPLVFSYSFSEYIVLKKIFLYRNQIVDSALKIDNLWAHISDFVMNENDFVSDNIFLFSIYQSKMFFLDNFVVLNENQSIPSLNKIIAISGENSNLYLNDISFEFSVNSKYNFSILQSYKNSFTSITNSNFRCLRYSQKTQGLINSDSSSLKITNCSFYKNFGPIFALMNSNFSLENSIFHETIFSTIKAANEFVVENINSNEISYFFLSFSKIYSNFGTVASLKMDFEVFLLDSIFEATSILDEGANLAFEIFETSKLEISNCLFINFNSSLGSAVYLKNTIQSLVTISVFESNFSMCNALTGGVFYFSSNGILKIENSIFISNKARVSKNALSGIAGVLFFETQTESDSNKLVILKNIFRDNSAEVAINEIYSSVCVVLQNNSFEYSKNQQNNQSLSHFSFPLKVNLGSGPKYFVIKSGSPFDISFSLTDCHDQVLNFEGESVGNINVASFTGAPIASNTVVTKAYQGLLSFTNVRVSTDQNSAFKLTLTLNLYNQITRKLNKIQTIFNFTASNCSEGEIILSDKACFRCQVGTYSSNDFANEIENLCLLCPENAYCFNGNQITPERGYWRSSRHSRLIILCNVPEACLGFQIDPEIAQNPTEMNITGACKLHHYGFLCDLCEDGYGKYDSNSACEKCQSLQISTVIRAFLILIFIILFVIHSSNAIGKEEGRIIKVVLTSLINYVQRVSVVILSEMEISSEDVKSYLKPFSFLNILSSDVYTNDCFIQNLIQSPQKFIFFKNLINLLLPIILSFVCLIVFSILNLKILLNFSKLGPKKNEKSISRNFNFSSLFLKKSILFFLICAFLCYGMLIQSFISLIDCIHLDDKEPQFFVKSNPNFECWVGLHLLAAAPISIIGIIVWGLFFPASLWKIMEYSQKKSNAGRYTPKKVQMIDSKVTKEKKKDELENKQILDVDTFQFFNKAFKKSIFSGSALFFCKNS